MEAIIQNKIITVFGDPGTGKTLLASFFAAYFHMCGQQRIYSNVDFSYKKTKFSRRIKDINDIEKIKFSENKGLVILDEGGLNINSRRSMSNDNLEYAKLGMLGRKKNVDIIIIAQLDYSVDKYFRDLSFCSFVMSSYFLKKDYLMFEMEIHKKGFLIGRRELDLFYIVKHTNYNYDTLEASIIGNDKKQKIIEKKKNEKKDVDEKEEVKLVEKLLDF